MNDKNTSIQELRQLMQKFVDERDWNRYHNPKDLAVALSIEANELLELFLFKNPEKQEILHDSDMMQSMKEELADVFAYLLSMINSLNLDLSSIFQEKMRKNSNKYPKEKFNGNYSKQ